MKNMADATESGYTGLQAYTLVPEPNSSYLINNRYKAGPPPLSNSTIGLLAIISTFQYQTPYMSPVYSNAAAQASKAAYIESGGQAMQDKFSGVSTQDATETVHSLGITDGELGAIFGTAKVVRDRKIDIAGPKFWDFDTHLTASPNSGSIGIKWSFE